MFVKSKALIFKNLLYLKEVISCGQISAAATKNGIKPSNLSKMIKDIEIFIGHKLFERTSHGVIPTQTALTILKQISELEERLDSLMFDLAKTGTRPVLKLYISKGLKIHDIDNFNSKIKYTDQIEQADVMVTSQKPTNTTHLIVSENKIGKQITQTIWVCCKDIPKALELTEFIILKLHHA